MNSYAPRISLSYDEVKLVIPVWEEVSYQVIVFQHDADAKVSRTHVHILILGCKLKDEALKRRFFKVYPVYKEADQKGNEFWKWAEGEYGKPDLSFITYMTKGKLRSKFSKNISPDIEESYREKWSEPTTDPLPSKRKEYDEYDEMKKSFLQTHDLTNNVPILLDNVRTWTMSWYWKRDGKLPPATAYKRNASSLYVWANEKRAGYVPPECWEELKNLWY